MFPGLPEHAVYPQSNDYDSQGHRQPAHPALFPRRLVRPSIKQRHRHQEEKYSRGSENHSPGTQQIFKTVDPKHRPERLGDLHAGNRRITDPLGKQHGEYPECRKQDQTKPGKARSVGPERAGLRALGTADTAGLVGVDSEMPDQPEVQRDEGEEDERKCTVRIQSPSGARLIRYRTLSWAPVTVGL